MGRLRASEDSSRVVKATVCAPYVGKTVSLGRGGRVVFGFRLPCGCQGSEPGAAAVLPFRGMGEEFANASPIVVIKAAEQRGGEFDPCRRPHERRKGGGEVVSPGLVGTFDERLEHGSSSLRRGRCGGGRRDRR